MGDPRDARLGDEREDRVVTAGETTMKIRAMKFSNARTAVEEAVRTNGAFKAILLSGEYLAARRRDVDRLEEAGVPFAYLVEKRGRSMTVPVNEG